MAVFNVVLEHVPGAGGYGQNGADDAALVAREIPGKPILLIYSRSDEHAREPVGTAMSVQINAQLDSKGDI
ncbi:MAG: hypothetical protein AB8B47_14040 [Roseobacter sp.]